MWDELTPPECPQDGEEDGAGLGVAGAELGPAQLGAGAGAGAGVATCVGAGGAAAGFGAAGFRAGLGAAGVAAAAGAAFLAGRFLALAFFADFLTDFLADFFADFLADLTAFFADFLAFFPTFFEAFFEDFFEVFLADFFFAISTFFFLAFSFLPFLFFFPLAIVTLLLPPINLYRSLSIGRFKRPLFVRGQSISAVSVQSPIRSVVYRFSRLSFSPGRGPPVAQSSSSIVCTTGTDVPPAICTMHPILPAAITSGLTIAMLATLRSRNLFAMSGWRML